MLPDKRKSKMVNFRMSTADYERFREICAARGLRSISELARSAMESFADSAAVDDSGPLYPELRNLRMQVRTLALEVDRLAALVETSQGLA